MAASPLSELTILYDDSCGLCTGAKAWLATQPAFIPLRFVPAGSDEARRRFPEVRPDELAVIADTGEVWMGNRAWIVCLWALRDLPGPRIPPHQSLTLRHGARGLLGPLGPSRIAVRYARTA